MKKLWASLSNRHITPQMDEMEVINTRIINQYALILAFVAILHAVFDFMILKTTHFYIIGLIGIYMLLMTLFTKVQFMRFYIPILLILLTFIIFYYSSANGFDNGLSFYYIVLISATPIVAYNSTYKFRFIFFLSALIAVLFTISNYYNFNVFPNGGAFVPSDKLRYIIIFNTLLFSGVNTYFILSKQQMIISQYNKIKRSESYTANLKNKILESDDIGPCIKEVVNLAINSDVTFVPAFCLLFPDVHKNLLAINPEMTPEEFRFCALLKLGFSTKDISTYDCVTVRSVQTRKSRLRKSFNIASEVDLYNWIESIE